jgi:hypothetical protein
VFSIALKASKNLRMEMENLYVRYVTIIAKIVMKAENAMNAKKNFS